MQSTVSKTALKRRFRRLSHVGGHLTRRWRRPERRHLLVRHAAEQQHAVVPCVAGDKAVPFGIGTMSPAHVAMGVGEVAVERDAGECNQFAHVNRLCVRWVEDNQSEVVLK